MNLLTDKIKTLYFKYLYAAFGILAGGIFNMAGDYIFVFTCDMGIFGAGLATAIGAVISFFILLSHFLSKKNTLKFVRSTDFFNKFKQICITGFSTFFIDIAMGILTILFNRQIMRRYLGPDALAVYGPIINVSTFVQCCAYSVGQAAQPIISMNLGAKCVLRGLVLSGALILILPKIFDGNSIWYSMPITEAIVAIWAIFFIVRYTKKLA